MTQVGDAYDQWVVKIHWTKRQPFLKKYNEFLELIVNGQQEQNQDTDDNVRECEPAAPSSIHQNYSDNEPELISVKHEIPVAAPSPKKRKYSAKRKKNTSDDGPGTSKHVRADVAETLDASREISDLNVRQDKV